MSIYSYDKIISLIVFFYVVPTHPRLRKHVVSVDFRYRFQYSIASQRLLLDYAKRLSNIDCSETPHDESRNQFDGCIERFSRS